MSNKSKRRRGKQASYSKKREIRQTLPARDEQQTLTQISQPVSPDSMPAPPASAPARIAEEAAARYPYVAAELRITGILAGIILAVLVVLALVLP